MDWETQPDPFRRFATAAEIELPVQGGGRIASLLALSLGLTAWKAFGESRWSLRANPSSGNLHPTEGYVVTAGGDGLSAGVLHYAPREHALELRCSLDREGADALEKWLPAGGFLVGLSSVLWREAWKYGERSLRYCALDLGHALGALDFAAAAVGCRVVVLESWSDADLARLLGLDRDADFEASEAWERELPEALVAVVPEGTHGVPPLAPEVLLCALGRGAWHGKANVLSADHHEWDLVLATAEATRARARRPVELESPATSGAADRWLRLMGTETTLETLVQQRRSAQSMNPHAHLALADFARLMMATVPDPNLPPWRGWREETRAHLCLFVHRVDGLAPGLYLFEREPADHVELAALLSHDSAPVPGLEDSALEGRLFPLRSGDCQGPARSISCTQDIAADGVFSLGMLCRFAEPVEEDPAAYRRLFWECGLIGQALYLGAEAVGLRGTGVGCFLDGVMHQLLGLAPGDERWQVLYHFTIGEPLDDSRLETLPAYAHLART
jgi:SagB-type dehydrogenase family enzyme